MYLGGDGLLKVIDVSVPPIPAEVGHFQFAMTPAGLFVRDRDVVVGNDDAGIWVVHNTHAEVAVELSGLAARRDAAGVRLSWETTTTLGIASYTVWRQEGGGPRAAVAAVAARDPFAYTVLDGLAPAAACTYWVEGVLAAGGSIWLGPATAAAATGSVVSLRCWPNPVRSAATFGFALPAPATVQLEVFDLRGRRVATVQGGEFAAGSHQAVWDRRDDGGQPVAAGTYLARLSGPDFVRTAKVLVRD